MFKTMTAMLIAVVILGSAGVASADDGKLGMSEDLDDYKIVYCPDANNCSSRDPVDPAILLYGKLINMPSGNKFIDDEITGHINDLIFTTVAVDYSAPPDNNTREMDSECYMVDDDGNFKCILSVQDVSDINRIIDNEASTQEVKNKKIKIALATYRFYFCMDHDLFDGSHMLSPLLDPAELIDESNDPASSESSGSDYEITRLFRASG